jgi:hypothetical protein
MPGGRSENPVGVQADGDLGPSRMIAAMLSPCTGVNFNRMCTAQVYGVQQ